MIIGGALQLHRRAGRAQAPARCERLSSGEHEPVGAAWSEGHLLSMVGSQLIGGLIRRAGGASFQELNLTVDDTAAMSSGGADLCHDFTTRPTYHQAILLSRPRHALGRARRPRSRRWRPSHDLEGPHTLRTRTAPFTNSSRIPLVLRGSWIGSRPCGMPTASMQAIRLRSRMSPIPSLLVRDHELPDRPEARLQS